LLWARRQLELNNWEIKKRDEEAMLDILSEATWPLREWFEENVIIDEAGRVKGSEAYDNYVQFCMTKGLKPMSRNDFYITLAQKATKYEREKSVWFKGITLKKNPSENPSNNYDQPVNWF
jgi:hypothetical protein